MGLTLYNTLTRRKEPFEPLEPAHVRIYVCGPTVYDLPHIGNARSVIVFDVLHRLMRRLFARVTFVQNITDIDDKIINAAKAEGIAVEELTERTTKAFHEDMAALGVLPPDVEPRATGHIPQMIRMIEKLIETGHAYVAEGHVLFHVPSLPGYGKLSRRDRRAMMAGARVEVAPYKKDPADFVLWKPSTGDLPGWESPWGRGRPGWHIECSAMSETHLGETFDIHGGGQDLIFPHHENEIAQSTCAHDGAPFVRYWMHNGYLTVNGEKMSKSLGNFFTVRDLLELAPGEAMRFYMLLTHYRQPLDWTLDGLKGAKHALGRLYNAMRQSAGIEVEPAADVPMSVVEALEDDLNTPLAISHLHEMATELNKAPRHRRKVELKRELLAGGEILGILQEPVEKWFKGVMVTPAPATAAASVSGPSVAISVSEKWIEERIAERVAARNAKDFAKADRIRKELRDKGVVLEDMPDGKTDWRRAG